MKNTCFGVDGKPTLAVTGIAGSTWKYDERGNKMEQAFFGVDGEPVLIEDGYARWKARCDKLGHEVERAYFGLDGKPTLYKDGNARVTYRYDERGNKIEMAYFDAEGNSVLIDGIGALVRYAYDDYDRRVSTVYLDERGQVVPLEVEVKEISPHGEAARIGMKPGDRLLSCDGVPLHSREQFHDRVDLTDVDRLGCQQLVYRREGATISIHASSGYFGADLINVRAAGP